MIMMKRCEREAGETMPRWTECADFGVKLKFQKSCFSPNERSGEFHRARVPVRTIGHHFA